MCLCCLQEARAAPCYPMWLAATGRALLTLGRLLDTAQPWLQQHLQDALAGGNMPSTVDQLHTPVLACAWLQSELWDLQQHPTAEAAAGVPPSLLQELRKLADSLKPQLAALGLCVLQRT